MKKEGIITLNGYFNYGNRLQNYALEKIIESFGYSVDTILVEEVKTDKSITFIVKIRRIISENPIVVLQIKLNSYINKIINWQYRDLVKIRTAKFKSFSKKYINETTYKISETSLKSNLLESYDYFVTGSDQVWNPNCTNGSSLYFLSFAPMEKRITYAASFGVSEISDSFKESYKLWLNEMAHISVREDSGAKIVLELAGRDAPVLVDPTLLLTKEKWLSISKVATIRPNEGYLLTYFLGGIPKKYMDKIKGLAKKNKLHVINLGNIRFKDTYLTDPSEFIDFINNCSIFCTDSFHGVVFSILLEKPFIVFERQGSVSMYSRINTLLDKFDLNSRKVENILSNDDVFYIDYSHIPSILENERNKALDYLKNALQSKDKE